MDCYNTVAILYNLKRPIFFSLQPQIRNQQVKQGLSLDQPGSAWHCGCGGNLSREGQCQIIHVSDGERIW